MAKKKTSVILPGGIAGLVQNAQQGVQQPPISEPESIANTISAEKPTKSASKPVAVSKASPAKPTGNKKAKPTDSKAASAQQNDRAYSLTPKNSADESWQMFLDMAHDYKQRQAPIATIYIDEELKRVLDRLKTAGPSRLSTTSIVSSIVARFIFDHEREIKELLYKDIP